MDLDGGPQGRHFVEVDRVRLRVAPQLAVGIVVIGHQNLVTVFVEVVVAPRVNVSLPFAQPGFHYPNPVALVAAALGEGPELLDAVGRGHWRGLVVQALGAGHLPGAWVGPLEQLALEMPVVLATRVSRGPVLRETYAFSGSEQDLLARGLISAGYLCASKARVLLSLALGAGHGAGRGAAAIRASFRSGVEPWGHILSA